MRRPFFLSATQFLAIPILLVACSPARGDWVNLDHFNYMAIGSALDGQDDWSAPGHDTNGSGTIAPAVRGIVEDPAEANRPVLEYSYDGAGSGSVPDQIWKPLGGSTIPDASLGTMYLRFYVPDYDSLDGDAGTFPDMVFALRPGPVQSSGSRPMGPHMRIQGQDNNDTVVLSVRPSQYDAAGTTDSDPGWIDLDVAPLATETWYDLWYVTDTSTDTFEIYMAGGAFGAIATPLKDDSNNTEFTFRDLENSGGDADLDYIWFRHGANHDGGRMLVDRIRMDSGENLTVPADGNFTSMSLTIDRTTGETRFINAETATLAADIRGYSLTSTTGALDTDGWKPIAGNYDASDTGNGSVDVDGNWTVLSDSESHTDLSEYQFGGDGGLIPIDDDVLLSQGDGPWIPTPNEEGLAMELVLADGGRVNVPILFIGNGGQPLKRSDLNFDGNVTGADWLIFVDKHLVDLSGLTGPQQYVSGDLDGDGDNDVQDFLIFQEDYEMDNGLGSFALMLQGVPEPSSLLLLGLGVVGFLMMGRKGHHACTKSSLLIAGVALSYAASMFPETASAAISYTGTAILEDFDSLPTASISDYFPNDGTPTNVPGTSGWIGARLDGSSGGDMNYGNYHTASSASTGEVVGGATNTSDTERSLGTLTSASHRPGIGVEIVNNTGLPLGSVTISFTQENWRTPGSGGGSTFGVQNITMAEYGTTASGITSANMFTATSGFTNESDLDLISAPPDSNTSAPYPTDGNLPANQAARSATIDLSSSPIGDGQSFFLRFNDVNDIGADGITAIDDFNFSATVLPGGLLRATINFATGEIVLRNDSGSPITIDRYQLDSDSDAFRTDDEYWNSLNDQNLDSVNGGDDPGETWDEAGGSNASVLAELFLIGGTTLTDGESISLGEAFDPAKGGSVTFEYHDKVSGDLPAGGIVILGDMDGSGVLDEADVPLFVQALVDRTTYDTAHPLVDADVFGDFDGNGLLDVGDLGAFSLAVSNALAALTTATAVPEPSSCLLVGMALAGLVVAADRRRHRTSTQHEKPIRRRCVTSRLLS